MNSIQYNFHWCSTIITIYLAFNDKLVNKCFLPSIEWNNVTRAEDAGSDTMLLEVLPPCALRGFVGLRGRWVRNHNASGYASLYDRSDLHKVRRLSNIIGTVNVAGLSLAEKGYEGRWLNEGSWTLASNNWKSVISCQVNSEDLMIVCIHLHARETIGEELFSHNYSTRIEDWYQSVPRFSSVEWRLSAHRTQATPRNS